MIYRRPKDSPIGVTHSDSDEWKQCDLDVIDLYPDADAYSLMLWFGFIDHARSNESAILFEVYRDGESAPERVHLQRWLQVPGAYEHAQHVFMLPDVLATQPLLVYRSIGAPSKLLVKTIVNRSAEVRRDINQGGPYDWQADS